MLPPPIDICSTISIEKAILSLALHFLLVKKNLSFSSESFFFHGVRVCVERYMLRW
jgi:hypothetical protein